MDLIAPPGDAARMAARLGDPTRGGWMLHADPAGTPTTAPKLRRLIGDFLQGGGSRLLYFSGHGAATDWGFWLVTADAVADGEGIELAGLMNVVARSPAQEILLVLDCCHAGGAATIAQESFFQGLGPAVRTPPADRAWSVLAGCAPRDLAYEARERGVWQGCFTSAVLRALDRSADADGRVRVGRLSDDVGRELAATPYPRPHSWWSPQGRPMVVGYAPPTQAASGPAPFRGDAERAYLSALIERHRLLPLPGLGSAAGERKIALEEVYVPLCTRESPRLEQAELKKGGERKKGKKRGGQAPPSLRAESEPKRVRLQELLPACPRLAVIGPPGSGKSTLLAYIALVLAQARLSPGSGEPARRLGLRRDETELPAPILVSARELAERLAASEKRPAPIAPILAQVLQGRTLAALAPDSIEERLAEGSLLLLLDGLDEVADSALRVRVMEVLRDVAAEPRFGKTAIVWTCRTRAFEKLQGWQGFDVRHVDAFDDEDIRTFVRKWTDSLPVREEKGAYAGDLTKRILESRSLRQLASCPLTLTMIGVVHYGQGRLPDDRARLYELCCDYLLNRRDVGQDADSVRPGVRLPETDRWAVCQEIAWELMRKEAPGGRLTHAEAASIVRANVGWAGLGRTPEPGLVDETLSWLELRPGVLASDAGMTWGFRHKTFQEFLAARRLQRMDGVKCWETLRGALTGPSGGDWHEAYVLLARLLSEDQRAALLRRIVEAGENGELPKALAVSLTERAFGETGRSGVDDALLRRVETLTTSVLDVVQNRAQGADVRTRIEVAQLLGRFGDPRLGRSPTDLQLVPVSGGKCTMGSGESDPTYERPAHDVDLAAYGIGRFPITNAQYLAFVEATGNQPPKPEFVYGVYVPWEEGRPRADRLTHPVVGVSWHDAVAYCRWLARETHLPYRLPTEAEWEWAARGTERRIYPWGSEYVSGLANDATLGLQSTTPVGIFPAGAGPTGCLDLAGNVWEWCSSLYKPYPYSPTDGREDLTSGGARVLRGGAWSYEPQFVRAGYRFFGRPDSRDVSAGFRVVVSAGV
ncbi:MAG: SUMF1/EgtB/PvdO family nonheme iron enzyme [Planctomycetes bacterium]|nr:SUMF1/EgtB/PvdO family nonheme iron enzyme [Planctomycetota bacterium]